MKNPAASSWAYDRRANNAVSDRNQQKCFTFFGVIPVTAGLVCGGSLRTSPHRRGRIPGDRPVWTQDYEVVPHRRCHTNPIEAGRDGWVAVWPRRRFAVFQIDAGRGCAKRSSSIRRPLCAPPSSFRSFGGRRRGYAESALVSPPSGPPALEEHEGDQAPRGSPPRCPPAS